LAGDAPAPSNNSLRFELKTVSIARAKRNDCVKVPLRGEDSSVQVANDANALDDADAPKADPRRQSLRMLRRLRAPTPRGKFPLNSQMRSEKLLAF
jgi:hypothetical protein